jgi:penicillin G amidase
MKKWFIILLTLVALLAILGYLYFGSLAPKYKGELELAGLSEEATVSFDNFGVPHIQASNKADLYMGLGYTIASERLFQMEMMRRVGHGQLSEILGSDFISTDALFRSLFPDSYFKEQCESLELEENAEMLGEIEAYLAGVNQFVQKGSTPLEFTLLGIEKRPFERADLFAIAGYMAYSFGLGQRTDPLITYIQEELGSEYLRGLELYHETGADYIPGFAESRLSGPMSEQLFGMSNQHFPVPLWEGSNSWVVSGERTESGKPIFCNDTHIAYSLPQVWYEAHLTCPGFNFYGYFLGGIPFALVGHNDAMAWGLTMLEQDDMDFYFEQVDFSKGTYMFDGVPKKLEEQTFQIHVKDLPDTTITVLYTQHGPLVSEFYNNVQDTLNVSLWWDYIRTENRLLNAFHALNNCQNIEEAENACSQIHGPGLNVTYADTANNIAWWACAKIQNRPLHVNSKCFIDGSKSENDPLGYYNFSQNPKSVNPSLNWVCSANDEPAPIDSIYIPGYYKPNHRANRIMHWLSSPNNWSVESMKQVMLDAQSDIDGDLAKELKKILNEQELPSEFTPYLELLDWNGQHEMAHSSPVLYYRLLYNVLESAMLDELGQERFDNFLTTHWFRRCYPLLLQDPTSIWWNNSTSSTSENRDQLLVAAFKATVRELLAENGPLETWEWGKNHSLALEHPFAKESDILAALLNIGPYPIRGGYETINQASFKLEKTNNYKVLVGSQMRIIMDLGYIEDGVSIAPSGQSGHRTSKHYDDQSYLYRTGQFRPQLWDQMEVDQLDNKLILTPQAADNQ